MKEAELKLCRFWSNILIEEKIDESFYENSMYVFLKCTRMLRNIASRFEQ